MHDCLMHTIFINMSMALQTQQNRKPPPLTIGREQRFLPNPALCRWKTEPQVSREGDRMEPSRKGRITVLFFRIVFPVDLTEQKASFLIMV